MAWHAKKSASGSKQWIKCPGSLAFVAGLPESMRRPTGAAAMLGTCAHGLAETCLNQEADAEQFRGAVIWLDKNEDATVQMGLSHCETAAQVSAVVGEDVKFIAVVDDKMIEGVQLYLDVCREAQAELGAETETFTERRFNMDWLRPGLGGTADCTVWQFLGPMKVIDYKNGYVAVDAEDNTQALTYALGMAQEVEWMFEEVEVIIVQPNNRGEKVKRWNVTMEELKAFQVRLAEASDLVDQAFEDHAACTDQLDLAEWASTYLDAGTDSDHGHCTFCDGLAICPAATAKAESLAVADFDDLPPMDNPLEVHDEQSLERLVRVIKWADWLDSFVKAAKTLGQRRLEQGLEVPGHKLVEGKTNRAWINTDAETALLMSKAGFSTKDLFVVPEPKLLSPAKMEKLGAARSAERKKAKELVEQLAAKPPGKLTMAPETDPRDEVKPAAGAADDFVDDVPWEAGDE